VNRVITIVYSDDRPILIKWSPRFLRMWGRSCEVKDKKRQPCQDWITSIHIISLTDCWKNPSIIHENWWIISVTIVRNFHLTLSPHGPHLHIRIWAFFIMRLIYTYFIFFALIFSWGLDICSCVYLPSELSYYVQSSTCLLSENSSWILPSLVSSLVIYNPSLLYSQLPKAIMIALTSI
jgi:hypothetical protein